MEMKFIRAMVLSALLAAAAGSAGPEGEKYDYNEETQIGPMPVTVEFFFALIFVALIASVPLILLSMKGKHELTKAHVIESSMLVVWLTCTLYLFTNVLKFNSGHWTGSRPLTLVEAVYVLAQVLTTVGYGDITPAFPRGQVWVAINVLLALCLYGSIIMEVSELVQERIKVYVAKRRAAREDEQPAALRGQSLLRTACGAEIVSGTVGGPPAPPLRIWSVQAHIDYAPLTNSAIAFCVAATIGVLFWHYYPGENKTWLQAIYMSIITLSTVGFGWFNATTEGGKVFGAFWMMFGVATLAATLTNWCEVMVKLKQVERLNEDGEKLAFFRIIGKFAETRDDEGNVVGLGARAKSIATTRQKVIQDRSMDQYDFLKFGLLLTKAATESDLETIEARFKALGPDKDGLVSRRAIEESEAPPQTKA